MNEENDREPRTEEAEVVNEEVNCVSREEVKNALRRMKKGKAVGPDVLPVEVWKCMREMGIKFLTRLFNKLLMGKWMPEEWKSVLISIYKNKGDAQDCGSYRETKLMSHTMKIWERIIKARLRNRLQISKQLHCAFADLEKAYDRFQRRAVVRYEKIRNSRKACATGTGYVRGSACMR